ncbi:MAG TPA: alpha/beta fold hydrolase [Burkholderiales bacterium]|nr:alpha/beta fold hydrolase [Burkholderiales bacterium]
MSWIEEFPGNFVWSNAALVTKGMAPYGAIAMDEVDRVCQRLRTRQNEPDAWREEWCLMGKRLELAAQDALAAKREWTAGDYFLRSGMYYFTGERFVYPGEEKREIGRKAIECQQAGLLRRYRRMERVEVPYQDGTLPALFLKADGAARRAPTIVVFDGMDNCKEMSVLFAGLEFAKRGWNTLAIDGPGQGESLRLRGLYARHDYEVPGAAAFDYVASRPDVDARKVVAMGYSFGGYYAARIAAMEKRYAAGVAMSALHWDLHGWQAEVKRKQDADPKSVAQSTFHFRWIMGHLDDANAALEKAKLFSLVDVAPGITCPFFIVHGAEDKVVPVASAHKLFEAISSKRKALKILTAEEGGSYHAQADNRQVGIDLIADWIAETLSSR